MSGKLGIIGEEIADPRSVNIVVQQQNYARLDDGTYRQAVDQYMPASQ